jgi:hypothetical protein
LTNLVFPLAIGYSFSTIKTREREYYSLFLLMQTATLGVFLSLDLFLFYVFWEFALVPMYFIIGIWGGDRRIYASLKFFVYTMLGSVLMLLGILYIGYTGGTFDLEALMKANLWAASAPQGRQHIELPPLQLVLGKCRSPGQIEASGQPGDARKHLQRFDIEVRELTTPRCDDPIDVVARPGWGFVPSLPVELAHVINLPTASRVLTSRDPELPANWPS